MTSIQILTLIAAVGSGLVAGIFFAFSNFVMQALARVSDEAGIAVMQEINKTVLNPLFALAFFGTAIICIIQAVMAYLDPQVNWHLPTIGGLLYVVGCFGVTLRCNVPWNNKLEVVDAKNPSAHALWSEYQPVWTLWNSVRTVAALAGSVVLLVSMSL